MKLRYFCILALVLLLACIAFFITQKPRSDASWIEEQSRQSAPIVADESVLLSNVRDWTYDENGPITRDWVENTIEHRKIVRTWFLIEPFSSWDAVGHTFLSFELEDGSTIAFSVEARREQGEEYSAVKGAFNAYELSYQWGTERDLIARRLVYLDHPLRMYPLTLTPEQSQAIFLSLVDETNKLTSKPRFYNTFAANCTNVLAKIVNRHYPDTLPLDLSWYMTGYADTYLMKEDFIAMVDNNTEFTKSRYDLTSHRGAVASHASDEPRAFSDYVRELLTQ